jgi:hypothetical protein
MLTRLFQVPSRVGKQGNVAGLLHSRRHNPLVLCARACLSARADLAIFGNVFSKKIGFLIVNGQRLVGAELTEFWLCKKAAFAALVLAIG